jgi:hypothetical protein
VPIKGVLITGVLVIISARDLLLLLLLLRLWRGCSGLAKSALPTSAPPAAPADADADGADGGSGGGADGVDGPLEGRGRGAALDKPNLRAPTVDRAASGRTGRVTCRCCRGCVLAPSSVECEERCAASSEADESAFSTDAGTDADADADASTGTGTAESLTKNASCAFAVVDSPVGASAVVDSPVGASAVVDSPVGGPPVV